MIEADWRAYINVLTPDAAFGPPATDSDIALAEQSLGVTLPDELRSLYRQSNGVRGEYELGLVWALEQVVEENSSFRSNTDFVERYMPFQPLLFFADAGNGDLFAFTILAGQARRPDVFVWNHETASRVWVAPDMRKYLDWWLWGRLKV